MVHLVSPTVAKFNKVIMLLLFFFLSFVFYLWQVVLVFHCAIKFLSKIPFSKS